MKHQTGIGQTHIDITDTQLCDAEMADFLEYSRVRAEKDARQEAERQRKMRDFRFKGGTL